MLPIGIVKGVAATLRPLLSQACFTESSMKHDHRLRRRSFVGLGAAGLASLPAMQPVLAATRSARAKQVLVLFEQGGVCQMDSFDPKPNMAAEHASPYGSVQTKIPGVHFSELLTETAKHIDKMSVIRCMIQPKPGIGDSHPRGSMYILQGAPPPGSGGAFPKIGPDSYPDIGSVVSQRLGTDAPHLPSYIVAPATSELMPLGISTGGFLPPAHAPFKTGGEPHKPDWTIPNLSLVGVNQGRFRDRSDLLSNLDLGFPGTESVSSSAAVVALREQAEDMLTNPATRKAFDLKGEPQNIREKYGVGHRGQCYLLGRKLIEAGVRFVTLDVREPASPEYAGGFDMNWDHHDFIYSDRSTAIEGGGPGAGRWGIGTWPMMGSTDKAFAALLDDMDERGLLDETLVCFVTEFGRTPRINARKGRDHWVHAFSFAFAGAGVPGGQVVGETDDDGGYVTSSMAYTIDDYAATIYEKLGIDRSEPIYNSANRPHFLAKDGTPIPELM